MPPYFKSPKVLVILRECKSNLNISLAAISNFLYCITKFLIIVFALIALFLSCNNCLKYGSNPDDCVFIAIEYSHRNGDFYLQNCCCKTSLASWHLSTIGSLISIMSLSLYHPNWPRSFPNSDLKGEHMDIVQYLISSLWDQRFKMVQIGKKVFDTLKLG